MTGYYDIVLGLIPLTLGGISATLTGVGLDLTTAVPLASLIAVALIGHALFVNHPVDERSTPSDSSASSDSFQPAD
jgi:hypothetical protein